MHFDEVMKAIDDLMEETGLNALEEDIEAIQKEIDSLNPFKTGIRLEKEIRMAKINGLSELHDDKKRKLDLDLNISPSFIMEMVDKPDIKYPIMVRYLVIGQLSIQNGDKAVIPHIKGALADILINHYKMGKNKAGDRAAYIIEEYISPKTIQKAFNAKKGKNLLFTITDFGIIFRLP